jgi:proteasome lid subunit RPN8/RPN11
MSPATGKTAEPDFASWSVPLLPSAIEYPLEVMDEIRAYACDELLTLAHGSREVGGVLFGLRRENTVRILTWRPITCEYADGDNLHLSPADALALAIQMERARVDPNLKDLKPVGCFICHPRGSVSLSRSDRETYNGFFPESWQIALVLHLSGGGVVRAGFFGRELDGNLKADESYQEFALEPLHTPPPAETVVSEPAPVTAPPLVPEVIVTGPAALPPPPSFQISEPVPSHERWLWAVPVALALLLIGLAFYHWRGTPGTPRSLGSASQASAVQPETGLKPVAASAAVPTQPTAAPPAPTADSSEVIQLRAERDQLAAQVRQKDNELRKERARADQLQNLVRILENRLNIPPDRSTSAVK